MIASSKPQPTKGDFKMSKPTHTAYVVKDAKEGTDQKAKWREVGAVWPHKSGKGFDVVLFEAHRLHRAERKPGVGNSRRSAVTKLGQGASNTLPLFVHQSSTTQKGNKP
jgi:hypothetical protein